MKMLNILGEKYGRLLVVKFHKKAERGRGVWVCRCDCGIICVRPLSSLRSGGTRSCGCLHREKTIQRSTKHGHCAEQNSTEYMIWQSMKSRVLCINHKNYFYYGGRGIVICKRWMVFKNFLKDMGLRPKGKTLDRINNNKGYCKSNCRWATWSEQMRNRRSHKECNESRTNQSKRT